jgi:spore germination cell wall hydrolase CwlJ-like protein
MLKHTRDALRRADRILVAATSFVLLMAGVAIGDVPSTDQSTVTRAPIALQIHPALRPAIDTPDIRVSYKPDALTTQQVTAMALVAQSDCLAEAMYYEARGEGQDGQLAVAEVIYNRMRSGSYPKTICQIVFEGSRLRTGCQFSFTCDGELHYARNPRVWRHMRRLALQIVLGQVQLGDLTGGALSFHAVSVAPGWSDSMEQTTQIGNHIFYRPVRHVFTRAA